jgi:predicted  nucleic acid-binding Zn-ribbon protein
MTATPREVVQRLRELQDLDARIVQLDHDVAGGPRAVESFARAVAAAEQKIAGIEERTKLLRAQAKLRENEAKTAGVRVDRLNEQARAVSTNKEFTAIRSEIANAKLDVGRLEDEILKIMEVVEQHEKLAAAAGEDRAREKKRLDAERAKVEAGLEGLRRERARLAESRPALTKDVPMEALAAYERVLKARGNAVVPVEIDYCSGCNERLTRNDVYCVQNASRLVQCKSCARILYWDAV